MREGGARCTRQSRSDGADDRALTGKLAALAGGLSWLVAVRTACPGASVVAGTGTRRAPSKGHKGGHPGP